MYIQTIQSICVGVGFISGIIFCLLFPIEVFAIFHIKSKVSYIFLAVCIFFLIISLSLKGKLLKEQENECFKIKYIGFNSGKCKNIREYYFQQEVLLKLNKLK